MTLKQFVAEYSYLIDQENFRELFNQASKKISKQDRIKLTKLIVDAELNPAVGLEKLPPNFLEESNITVFDVPEGVVSIGSNAFSYCGELVLIHLPSSLRNSYLGSFYECNKLKDVYFNGSLEDWCKINFTYPSSHPLFNANIGKKVNLYVNNILLANKLVVPSTISIIKQYAFQHCEELTELVLPRNITELGECSFSWCSGLTSVHIKNKDIVLSNGCFYNVDTIDIFFDGTKAEWKQVYNPRAFEHTYFTVNCTDGKIVKKKK